MSFQPRPGSRRVLADDALHVFSADRLRNRGICRAQALPGGANRLATTGLRLYTSPPTPVRLPVKGWRAVCVLFARTCDFIHDRTASGRPLKWLTLVDEYTRECLVLHAAASITGADVRRIVARVIGRRGAPTRIRSDNVSEFICATLVNGGRPEDSGSRLNASLAGRHVHRPIPVRAPRPARF
jgi:transposase InsO family protein